MIRTFSTAGFFALLSSVILATPDSLFAQDANETMPAISWRKSLPTGTKDRDGNMLGGTEIRALTAFDGKLFAANGYWTDRDAYDPDLPGGQIFVLDRSPKNGGRWRQDMQLTERVGPNAGNWLGAPMDPMQRRYHTIASLAAVEFATDSKGIRLKEPKRFLIAGAWQHRSALEVLVRSSGDEPHWETSTVVAPRDLAPGVRSHIRSFTSYRDKVTGVDLVFGGAAADARREASAAIYSGAYDPTVSGSIRWSALERWNDRPGIDDRVTSFVEANG